MGAILVLEDSQVLLSKLSNELKKQFPELQTLPARTIAEAQLLLNEFEIGVFLLDVCLPDGSGIDFLCDVRTISPDSVAIIMSAQQIPEFREQAESLGVIRFFQKPVDTQTLFKVIHKAIHPEAAAETAPPSHESFQASLSSLTTVDIIQLKCLARSTQVLQFTRADGLSGKIHFQRGEIVHAETSAHVSGLDAFNEIVAWKGGRVSESNESIAEASINQGWESLLMDAVRRIDELAATAH